MSIPYIALYPSDYLADTAHLGLTEHGIYWRMLLHYYQHAKPYPNDISKIERVILANTPEEKRTTEFILGEFFHLTRDEDGLMRWHHDRADKEIAAAEARIMECELNRKMGSYGGKKSAETRKLRYGTAQPQRRKPEAPFEGPFEVPFEPPSEAPPEAKLEGVPKQPEPEPELDKEKKKTKTYDRFAARLYLSSKGLDDQTITDWLAIRRDKKLTPTQAGIEAIEHEAEKAGKTLPEAIHICCQNSWAGFKASWLASDRSEPDYSNVI